MWPFLLRKTEAASRSAFSEAQLLPEDIQWFGLYAPWRNFIYTLKPLLVLRKKRHSLQLSVLAWKNVILLHISHVARAMDVILSIYIIVLNCYQTNYVWTLDTCFRCRAGNFTTNSRIAILCASCARWKHVGWRRKVNAVGGWKKCSTWRRCLAFSTKTRAVHLGERYFLNQGTETSEHMQSSRHISQISSLCGHFYTFLPLPEVTFRKSRKSISQDMPSQSVHCSRNNYEAKDFPINTHGGLLAFGAPWEAPDGFAAISWLLRM